MQTDFLLNLESIAGDLRTWYLFTLPPLLVFVVFFCFTLYHLLKLCRIGKDAPETLWRRQAIIVVILAGLTLISLSILLHTIMRYF